jgi:hypothetical protein
MIRIYTQTENGISRTVGVEEQESRRGEVFWIDLLTPDAEEEDIRLFSETIKKRNEAKYREYLDGIYQVSVSANRELYVKMMKEDRGMCDALKELMKDEFMETEARGEARGKAIGEAQGEIKGMIKFYHEEMGLAPQEITIKIMKRCSLDEETARNFVESTLG